MSKLRRPSLARLICLGAALCLLLTACSTEPPAPLPDAAQPRQEPALPEATLPQEEPEPEPPPLPCKIGIITNPISQREEEYWSAQLLVEQYGPEQVIHELWPDNFMDKQEEMRTIVAELGKDPEIKILILNQAVPGSNAAIAQLRESRDDIFVVYCTPSLFEDMVESIRLADLLLFVDESTMGVRLVEQAQRMGAKAFVYYSWPRHSSQSFEEQRNSIVAACEALDIKFVDGVEQDDSSLPSLYFLSDNLFQQIEQHGKDTAFYAANCFMQVNLITRVVENGAIYPQPCCPSPYHGFPAALGIETDISPPFGAAYQEYIIAETSRIMAEQGMSGRVSSWPVSSSIMNTLVGAAYGLAWLAGEAPQEGLDLAKLQQLMEDYAGVAVTMRPYEENSVSYDNYQLYAMDYLVY